MTTVSPEPTITDEKTYCAVHPTVEATLRCNKCGRYMCLRCAVKVPVGYRCRQCVYEQQGVFYKATQRDDLIAAGVALALGLPAGYILPRLGLFIIIIFAIPAGALIGDLVFRACGKRRSRYTWLIVAVIVALSAFVAYIPFILEMFNGRVPAGALFSSLLPPLLYAALSAGAAAVRLR